MNLFLIRHGLSIANTKQLVTGDVYDHLCDQGISELEIAKTWFQDITVSFAKSYTSQWLRARETASILFEDQVFKIDERLGESQAGEVANWPLTKFLREMPDFYNDPQRCYPGGESHHQLKERVMAWLQQTYEQYSKDNILAVSHSGPIACLVQQALYIPMKRFPALLPAHGSLTIIKYNNDTSGLPIGKLQVFSATSTKELTNRYSSIQAI